MKVLKVSILTLLLMLSVVAVQATPPWLEGVELPPVPTEVSPVLPATMFVVDGSEFPATFTEDVPVLLGVDSEIFAELPPSEYRGVTLSNAVWAGKPVVYWMFTDWEKKTKALASTTEVLAINQMYVAPADPTGRGAIEVFMSRQMDYEYAPGRVKRIFVNSSRALNALVTDITPPLCGLEITVDDNKATIWPIESPPNQYPLPKLADIIFEGSLFCEEKIGRHFMVSAVELGDSMIVDAGQGAIHVAAHAEIKLMTILQDNYQLDEASVRFGLADGALPEPAVVGSDKAFSINLAELDRPDEPYLFIEAKDVAGNRQLMYIPLVIK